ncbi:protein-cysteine N-palmitoyltransferase HHAT-like protein isoform X4 [Mauremys reevesii]|uniref:protein-cysteine N-palmitoyltransferase HHAT-like protein isoform X4 n=1 Tax=Mauremys reevesii TaxID=260615 RepID=UPI00194006A6|nr:protein-cysteine N-palmitoyltransferase HHAT-like protein isoform X4 [Mauremys reevesii]
MGIKAALPSYELGFYALILTCAVVYSGNGIFDASRAQICGLHALWDVGRAGHHGPRLPDDCPLSLHCALRCGAGEAEVVVLCGRALQPGLFQAGTFQHVADVLFYGGSGFTIMRCMSFALENSERKEGIYSIIDLLKYNFYLPFFFFGPIMTFDRFYSQVSISELRRKDNEMWNIRVQAFVNLGAIVAVDVFFHFFYILTLPADVKFVSRLSDWALAGLAYCNLVYDWLKAAVMFGVINTIARLDHLDPPQPPKCITMLYVFAETHFDRGINDWLCKYIYDHLGENHDNVVKELRATICTFAVTTLWLGPCEIVYIWSVCNCFGLNFELWVQKFFQREPFGSMEANMSEPMSRRIRGIFGAANFWAIVLYNVLALNSLDFTLLVAKRILLTGFPLSTLSIWFITYCGVQLIKERERLLAIEEEKRDKEKAA